MDKPAGGPKLINRFSISWNENFKWVKLGLKINLN